MQVAKHIARKSGALMALLFVSAALISLPTAHAQSQTNAPQQQQQQRRGGGGGGGRRGGPARGEYKSQITPHWFHDNTRFWYRNELKGNTSEFILVDAEAGTRNPAFDHDKLAAALSKAAGGDYQGNKLPFSSIEFVDGDKSIQFSVSEKTWKCDLSTYECTPVKTDASLDLPASDSSLMADADAGNSQMPGEASVWNDASGDNAASASSFDSDPGQDSPVPQQDMQSNQSMQQGQPGQQGQRDQQQAQPVRGGRGRGGRGQFNGGGPRTSPDEKWTASIRDNNVFIQAAGSDEQIQLTRDGEAGNFYSQLAWSPDSKALVAWRTEPGDDGQVYLILSSPPGGGRAILSSNSYPQAGDKFTAYELNVFDIANRKQIKPRVDRIDFRRPGVRWDNDAHLFTYEKEDRGHQRFRVIAVDALNGDVRTVLDEKAKTFIWTDNTDAVRGQLWYNSAQNQSTYHITRYLQQSNAFLYVSEHDGWRHLYFVDLDASAKPETLTGSESTLYGAIHQITKGDWLVRGLDRFDENTHQIWFEAGGMVPGQNPYFVQFCRINFDGSGLTVLTEGDGDHSVAYSPDNKYLIDTYSRPDLPPVNNLRHVSDGSLVCKLEESDISELLATGWKPPEVFVAKGRDGATDIYGMIDRPRDLDPNKKYPILEDIYAGPQGSPGTLVPTTFRGTDGHANYTGAGLIVVKIDAMGSANRSKAFQDTCWHNLADAGFPDRILWMKAAAAKYPYMDLTRVGIYGTSAGGQNAAGALLFHPDFYKVAVANSGCHDNRIDKSSWNEQWMGYLPHDKIWTKSDDNWFSKCSNIDNAAHLRGKLFLIVGEQDHNVPPESTFRFVDALIKARKDFDMLVVPGADHGAASPITGRRTQDFLIANLLHEEIPNRNEDSSAPN
jgi:dipeptidyl aminopeptidase/acylaminoacyl peptidase